MSQSRKTPARRQCNKINKKRQDAERERERQTGGEMRRKEPEDS